MVCYFFLLMTFFFFLCKEVTASPMRDLATDSPRSKFLSAYNILFGAYVLRGVYPVIRKMLVSMDSANPEFRDRNIDRTVESGRDPLACGEKALAQPELEHGALLKNHLEVLGGGLMVAAHDVMERLGMEDQVNFIEEQWSEKDFSILVQDLEKARQETGAAATCDEISVYDQLLVCLHKLDRRFSYFDDSIW